jgi:hypothetical protein
MMERTKSFPTLTALSLAAALLLAVPSRVLAEEPTPGLKAGLGVEYLSRTISWDEDAHASRFDSLLFTFQAEVEAYRGVVVEVQAGYALSNFNGLVFRALPFSVDYQAGYMGGVFMGGGLKARLVPSPNFEVELEAALDACLSFPHNWPIEELAVAGTLEGKSSWLRISAGPVLWYKGLPYYVYPYLKVQYSRLWGTFTMTETIETLEGTENKKITGSGPVSLSLGILSEVSKVMGLRAEVTVLPRRGGVDIGAAGRLVFSF